MASAKAKGPKRKVGRPTTYDKDRAEQIYKALRAGNFFDVAVSYAGVHRATAYNWMRRGSKGEAPFKEFFEAVRKAETDSEVADVTQLNLHGKKTWQALAWRLERKHPERWGLRIRVHVEEELANVLDRLEKKLPPDQYEKVLEAIASDDGPTEVGSPASGPTSGRPWDPSGVGAEAVDEVHAASTPIPADEPD